MLHLPHIIYNNKQHEGLPISSPVMNDFNLTAEVFSSLEMAADLEYSGFYATVKTVCLTSVPW